MDVLIIVGESGSGKTTLQRRLEAEFNLDRHRSLTTRAPRAGEGSGDYEFVSQKEFTSALTDGKLCESAAYNGNLYGARVPESHQVMVLEPSGQAQVKTWCLTHGVRVATLYLTCSEQERVRRMSSRGDPREKALDRVRNDRYFKEFMVPGAYDFKIDATGNRPEELVHQAKSRMNMIGFFK